MARVAGPKCRICRRAGTKLFLKGERCFTSKCAIVRRNYAPGVQGTKKTRRRMTTYGIQLREKQRVKMYYRISEKQFRSYFTKASRRKGNTADNMRTLLETRLDNVVYRFGWARSHDEARQLVGHGMFRVNGKKVTIPSYHVRPGETMEIKQTAREYPLMRELMSKKEGAFPSWLHREGVSGKIVGLPTVEETGTLFDMKLIVEFYSR